MGNSAPLVTVILPTHNRPATLKPAMAGVLRQTFNAWELLVINDGGTDVGAIVEGFGDPRLRYVSFPENQGKAVCCNLGLEQARGALIAYLDDDDIWYPNHLEVLTRVFQENPGEHVAYTDLYRVGFILDEKSNQRIPIDKKIIVSRDFNRDFLFNRNHVLHVSLMHTLESGRRVGGYDPAVTAMIDWNMVRKLAFCYDFIHVPVVTGEYYAPFEVTDRISHIQVTDQEKFKRITRRVKADTPPRPWPLVTSVEVCLAVDRWRPDLLTRLARMLDDAPYPLSIRLLDQRVDQGENLTGLLGELGCLRSVVIQALSPGQTLLDAWRAGARESRADYLVLTHRNFDFQRFGAVFHRILQQMKTGDWDLIPFGPPQNGRLPDALVRREALFEDGFPQPGRIGRLTDEGSDDIPPGLKAEVYLAQAHVLSKDNQPAEAIDMIHRAVSRDRGSPGLASQMETLFPLYLQAGQYEAAERALRDLIGQGYRPDNYIRLGRILVTQGRYQDALAVFQKGLEALGLKPRHLDSPAFPALLPEACDAFTALTGMGECFYRTGKLQAAEQMFWMARKINYKNPRPYLGYAAILVDTGRLDEAETILTEAESLKDGGHAQQHYLAGKIHWKKGRDEKAFTEFMQAYAAGGHHWDVLQGLAEAGEKTNRLHQVAPLLEAYRRNHPGDDRAAGALAVIENRPAAVISSGTK